MSSNPYYAKCFQAPPGDDEKEEWDQSYSELMKEMSGLPVKKGLWHFPVRLYHGFWIPEAILPGLLSLRRHLPPCSPSDVFLVTFPKSGTTWLKALSFAIANRSAAADHPLLSRHPQDCSPFLEGLFSGPRVPHLDSIPFPRQLGTHVPYSLLPPAVLDSGCRIVYMCREPKDTLVSTYHFAEGIMNLEGGAERSGLMTMEEAAEFFCQGLIAYGPVWEHQLEYWQESLRRPEKVLFLKYEEMKADPERNVRRLAEFLGAPFSAEEESAGAVDEMVRLCSFEKLRGLEVNRVGVRGEALGWSINNSAFFRKGKVGDWREHLTAEMAERIDAITREKLQGSGLTHASIERK